MREGTRHVFFEACFNFRDLGGYPAEGTNRVRWRTIYRSDTLHRLTAADRQEFAALGLRTVIDLRSRTEVDDHGRLRAGDERLDWRNMPMLDNVKLAPQEAPEAPVPPVGPLKPGEGYLEIVEQFGESVAEVFEVLAREDSLPAVFHCTSGKDRTGIIAALLLDVLGVPDEVIAADYALTDRALQRSTPWIEANEPVFAAFLAQIPPERRLAVPETILGFLGGVRSTYGSTVEFLARRGVNHDVVSALRARLLEPVDRSG